MRQIIRITRKNPVNCKRKRQEMPENHKREADGSNRRPVRISTASLSMRADLEAEEENLEELAEDAEANKEANNEAGGDDK